MTGQLVRLLSGGCPANDRTDNPPVRGCPVSGAVRLKAVSGEPRESAQTVRDRAETRAALIELWTEIFMQELQGGNDVTVGSGRGTDHA